MDSTNQEYISISQAAALVPGRPSPSCVWRWCRQGIKSRSGLRVRLRHVRLGGRLFTTRPWIDEFGTELATADAHRFPASGASAPAHGGAEGPSFRDTQEAVDGAELARALADEGL